VRKSVEVLHLKKRGTRKNMFDFVRFRRVESEKDMENGEAVTTYNYSSLPDDSDSC